MASREFSLKDEQVEEKFKNYCGNNVQIQYVKTNQKMLVTHDFDPVDGNAASMKSPEYQGTGRFRAGLFGLGSKDLINNRTGTISNILKRSETKTNDQPLATTTVLTNTGALLRESTLQLKMMLNQ
ncbi:unnamed protein product [Adineta steineri]|uniref:Uncharacterized protein n=1 Tax=Adineta steineri TaxID=433720 RepID=A0A815P3S2_9BILA|nr:unnamed protein product [Adineta steineri]CAF3957295.1 unnamed protein product [Adineta steineri]